MAGRAALGKVHNVGLENAGRWYTQRDLLDAAEGQGYRLSQGLLEKWVSYGLLDQGTRHGRGQGRGASFLWPHNQLELLLVLLDKRATVSRTRPLLNLPVAIWLYWGEDFVPMRQVRRAMERWADVGRKRPRYDWNAMAVRVVEEVSRPGSRPQHRQIAADLVAELARTRIGDTGDLVEALAPVVGRGDPTAFTDAPRAAQLLVAQVTALTKIQELPDELFRWAQAMILVSQGIYMRDQPELARDPNFGNMHPSPTFEGFVQRACSHLVTTLGLYLVQPRVLDLPPALDPELWKAKRVRLSAAATYQPSRLSLPPWLEGGNIRVDVHIEVDPE